MSAVLRHNLAPDVRAVSSSRLARLPLVTLYLSERCNSRCVTCDYWRHGHADMSLARVKELLPSLERLRTELVLLSGGEPLLNPEWAEIARLLRAQGLKLWLLTSGLSLAKHARCVADLFDSVTVSLDGTNRGMYQAIRGLDAFENVLDGIRAAGAAGAHVTVRVTLQRANYSELSRFVELAHATGAHEISFLAVDVANAHAFGRSNATPPELTRGADVPPSLLALRPADLPLFEAAVEALVREHAEDFNSGFIAESPQKLRRMRDYFAAVCGLSAFPPVRCNAPEFSAVLHADGRLSPCFFIAGPAAEGTGDLGAALNSTSMQALRKSIRAFERPECARCVCSIWRDAL